MLDKAQEADPVILGLLERHRGARIIVGDKYQQLYQWRGAVNALSRLHSDSAELSLTQTFRFGAGVAAWANQVLEIMGERLRIIPARAPDRRQHRGEIGHCRRGAGAHQCWDVG